MKKIFLNLLPKVAFERIVPIQKLSKISLGFPKRVRWLSIITLSLFSLIGYTPSFSIPQVGTSLVFAQEQKQEVIAKPFPQPIILPHPGYLSTRYSSRHPGVDIAAGLGMPVHPVTGGTVEETGTNFFGLGKYVVISHTNEFKSLYAHLGKIYVKAGQQVSSENTLGEVGLTGKTSGPHTHLEITHNGSYVDPLTILPQIPPMPKTTIVKK